MVLQPGKCGRRMGWEEYGGKLSCVSNIYFEVKRPEANKTIC